MYAVEMYWFNISELSQFQTEPTITTDPATCTDLTSCHIKNSQAVKKVC